MHLKITRKDCFQLSELLFRAKCTMQQKKIFHKQLLILHYNIHYEAIHRNSVKNHDKYMKRTCDLCKELSLSHVSVFPFANLYTISQVPHDRFCIAHHWHHAG